MYGKVKCQTFLNDFLSFAGQIWDLNGVSWHTLPYNGFNFNFFFWHCLDMSLNLNLIYAHRINLYELYKLGEIMVKL